MSCVKELPLILILSLTSMRCGELNVHGQMIKKIVITSWPHFLILLYNALPFYLKNPVFNPQCLKILSQKAPVEPFPLVPLMCIALRLFRCSSYCHTIIYSNRTFSILPGLQAVCTAVTFETVVSHPDHPTFLSLLTLHLASVAG